MPSKPQKVSTPRSVELTNRIAELERAVARLEYAQYKVPSQKQGRSGSFMRQLAIIMLVILCGISSTLSVSALWVKRTVMNTDIWVEKTSQIVQDPAIRSTISTALTDQVFTQVDVENQIKQLLPERISGLSSTLSDNLKTAVSNKINDVIASDAFTETWAKASRSAHAGILESIKNSGAASDSLKQTSLMYINDQQLVLNLRPVFADVQNRLVAGGLGFIGDVNVNSIGGQINLVTIKHMSAVLFAITLIDSAAFYLPVLAIVFGAGAVALSINRRRTVLAIGWSAAVLMVVLVQLVNIARYPFIDASQGAAIQANTAIAAYGIITNDFVLIGQTFLVMALLLVVAGFISGPSKPAVFIRSQLARIIRVDTKQPTVVRWIGDNTGYTLAAISILTALLLVFPLVRGTVYPIVVVSIAVILSLVVATIQQGKTSLVKSERRAPK